MSTSTAFILELAGLVVADAPIDPPFVGVATVVEPLPNREQPVNHSVHVNVSKTKLYRNRESRILHFPSSCRP
jgi:hypothetical protein